MPVTRIVISSATTRPTPKVGDRRTTKAHGLQIRIPEVVTFGPHRGARVYRGSRPDYVWCKPSDLPALYRRYLTPEERDALIPQQARLAAKTALQGGA